MKYEAPKFEILNLAADVITTSGDSNKLPEEEL